MMFVPRRQSGRCITIHRLDISPIASSLELGPSNGSMLFQFRDTYTGCQLTTEF